MTDHIYKITFIPKKKIKCSKRYGEKEYDKGKTYTIRRKLDLEEFIPEATLTNMELIR